METVQGGVPPYGVKETLVVNGKNYFDFFFFKVLVMFSSNALLPHIN